MPHFFLKLVPCRPTFATDMTADEGTIMGQHVAYCRELMSEGKLLAFGPVLDAAGSYGIALAKADSLEEVAAWTAKDPVSTLHRYEIAPMQLILPGQ